MVNKIVETTLNDNEYTASLIDKWDAIRDILVLRGLEAGPGIDLKIVDADGLTTGNNPTTQKKIVISNSLPPVIIGESNTASNLGVYGEGVFYQKNGVDLQFKRIVAGSNIILSSDAETITISTNSAGEVNTGVNIGTGVGVFGSKVGTNLQFKSIIAGSGIGLVDNGNSITINSTVDVGDITTASNLGSGSHIFAQKNASDLQFRSLAAGQNVSLDQTDDTIIINVSVPSSSVVNFTDLVDTPSSYSGHGGKVLSVSTSENGLEFSTLSLVAKTGDYNNLINLPLLSTVAVSGSYDDLINAPTVPNTLIDLADVSATNPIDGQAIIWDVSENKWVAKTITLNGDGGILSIEDDTTPTLGGNLNVNGKSIVSVNGDISLAPAGGSVIISGMSFPTTDGVSGYALKTNGAGQLYWDVDAVGANGEINTVSNIGSGVGLYSSKNGVDFEFKSIIGTSKLSIIDSGSGTISLDVMETSLNRNNMGGGALGITNGGTGATDAAQARANLGIASMGTQSSDAVTISGGSINGVEIGSSVPMGVYATNLIANGVVRLNGMTLPTSDGTIGQYITTNGSGLMSWANLPDNSVLKSSNILYVAKNGNDTTGTGGISHPYGTITKALSMAVANSVIVVFPGTYAENITIGMNGVGIVGYGAGSDSRTVISGKITINGISDIILQNIKVMNSADSCLQIYNSGAISAFNCSFVRSANTDAIRIDGAMTGNVILQNIMVTGSVVNANTGSGGYQLVVRHARSTDMYVQNLTGNAITSVEDCSDIGWIRHDAGILYLSNIGRIVKNTSGYSIESSASQATHGLYLSDVNLKQVDGTYGLINKTASCPYSLSDTNRDVSNDVLIGSRSGFGRFAVDISANRNSINYNTNDASIKSHLDGIDAKLATVGTLQSIQDDTSPILGGDLNLNGNSIVSAGDVSIVSNGKLSISGGVSISNGNYGVIGDAQSQMYVLRGVSTSIADTELFLDGSSSRLVVPNDATWMFTAKIVARRTDADNESAAFELIGCVDNNAGSTLLVGNYTKTIVARDNTSWDVNIIVDDVSNTLKIVVTGENSKNIRWVAFVQTVEVNG